MQTLQNGFVWQKKYSIFIVLKLTGKLLLLLLLLHPLNVLFSRTTWVSRYQKGKYSLNLNEARDGGVLGCSGISWTICKQSAPRSRQITTPTPYHSIFRGRMLFLMPNQQCQSTVGKLTGKVSENSCWAHSHCAVWKVSFSIFSQYTCTGFCCSSYV